MTIHFFCLFYNEARCADLMIAESQSWIDQIHICESNRTFRGGTKEYLFASDSPKVVHHRYDGASRFHPPSQWGPSRQFPYFRKKDMARNNETLQRNYVHEVVQPAADDIVILGDLDEILDARHAQYLVDQTRKHGVISVKLHHTMFYLNLFSRNWHALWDNAPEDYAYRVFLMTGAYFNTMRHTSDSLRRAGEWGRHAGKIHLEPDFMGFHHSWLGDSALAAQKLAAYAHSASDHRSDMGEDPEAVKTRIAQLIAAKQSLFDGHVLEAVPMDQAPHLPTVAANPAAYADLVVDVDG